MGDVIITGAGRGIGRAVAVALERRFRQVVVARTAVAAGDVVREAARRGKSAQAVVGDLSTVASARALGDRLCSIVRAGATLVHNAGVWPRERLLNADGFESAFAVNVLGALAMQAPLIARGLVKRILVIGSSVMAKGRFDAEQTPSGLDFDGTRTYASSKLALAVAMQDVARAHPTLDIAIVDPGTVRTELGAREGFLGWLTRLMQGKADPPEVAGERIARIIAYDRWSTSSEAVWIDRDAPTQWPVIADKTRSEIQRAVASILTPVEAPKLVTETVARTSTTAWRKSNDSTLN